MGQANALAKWRYDGNRKKHENENNTIQFVFSVFKPKNKSCVLSK